jgi:hypothetical protein
MRPRTAALLGCSVIVTGLAPRPARADLPAAVVERPSTLPGRMLQVDASFDHESAHVLGVETLDAEAARLAVRWGVTSALELGLEARVRVHPDPHWIREATPELAWRVLAGAGAGARIDVTPSARLPLFADRGYDVATHLDLGAGLRAHLGDRWLLSVGRTLTSIDFRPVLAWHLLLDADLGVQVTPALELAATVQLGQLTLAGPLDRTLGPWDTLPVAVRAVWAARPGLDATIELGASALQQPGDGYVVSIGVAVRP